MLTKSEVLAAVRSETVIVTHLVGKLEAKHLDFRFTPPQRSTIELLRYLAISSQCLLEYALTGSWDRWDELEPQSVQYGLGDIACALARQQSAIERRLQPLSDQRWATMRAWMPSGPRIPLPQACLRHLVTMPTAYRMQLFLQAKASGLAELGSANLWRGVDAPKK
jgi:hypothetical protein